MTIEEVVANLPIEAVNKLISFVTFLQAIGILFALYLVVMIVKAFFTFKTNKIIRGMANDLKKIKKQLKVK